VASICQASWTFRADRCIHAQNQLLFLGAIPAVARVAVASLHWSSETGSAHTATYAREEWQSDNGRDTAQDHAYMQARRFQVLLRACSDVQKLLRFNARARATVAAF
jgi:hypothetical protein